MTEFFQQLLMWIQENPQYAGMIIFSVALAESLAIVGVLIPGVIILFGAGTLIGAGIIDFWTSCLWAVAGAIIGDGLSFWLGCHFDTLSKRWPILQLSPEHMEKGTRFFQEYGDISVAIGRFFGPIRAVIPMIAGMLNMPAKRFYIANILSALVWAPSYLAPGMILGDSLQKGANADWRQLAIIAAAILFIVIFWFVSRKIQEKA